MYKVIRAFRDKEDNLRTYHRGDTFPAKGTVKKERLDVLLSKDNDLKQPAIEEVIEEPVEPEQDDNPATDEQPEDDIEPEEFPKHTGGGYFELSNGDKVKGKEDAIKAEKELK